MASNLVFTLTGGASNSDPNASLGGVGSSVELVVVPPLNNLFDDVTASQAEGGSVEYRAIDIFNDGDQIATSVEFFFDLQTLSAFTSVQAGLDGTTQTIPDESTAPSGITFTEPTSIATLAVADIAINGRQRLWIRRTVTPGATNTPSDQAILAVTFA